MRITLADSRAEWATAFAAEEARLGDVLGPVAQRIEHIGSTSVPGLAAKPVIDIQVGVSSIEEFNAANGTATLEAAGYTYLPQYEDMAPFRRLFTRDINGVRTNNLHLVENSHPWFRRHIVFRDFLRENDAARMLYENVKRALAQKEWDSVNDYASAKSDVVIGLEEEAFTFFDLSEKTRAWLRSSRV